MTKKITTDTEITEPPAQRKKRELKETLLSDPRIKVLYFDRAGNHFFRSFQADNGKRYSRFHVEYTKDSNGKTIRTEKPMPENEITETVTADDWLKNNN